MSGYIGTQPVPQSTQTRDSFTATSGQTSFATGGYQSGYIDLYLNGIKLAAADYTATNNSDVVLAVGATTGDILEVVAYTAFNTANVTGAVDFTVTGLFTSRGIDDNADATAITIDSSENVSLTGALDVTGTATANKVTIGTSSASNGKLTLEGVDGTDSAGIYFNNTTATNGKSYSLSSGNSGEFMLYDRTSNAYRLVVDTSGTVLVGKTATTLSVAGAYISASGSVGVTRASDDCLTLNRTGNDGAIASFYKDGSTVGQIGTYGSTTYIGSTAGGIMFNGTDIEPTTGGATRVDNTVSLGSSAHRFTDLYLGGGVYLGGTGSANKLDDYEIGTFSGTTTFSTYTAYSGNCLYTKIGDLVHIQMYFIAVPNTTALSIGGFPFTSDRLTTFSVGIGGGLFLESFGRLDNGTTNVVGILNGTSGSSQEFYLSCTYRAV